MKILLVFALLFSFAYDSLASPLIFKTSKKIEDMGVLAKFKTSDHKQIRIAVALEDEAKETIKMSILGVDKSEYMPIEMREFKEVFLSFIIATPPDEIEIRIIGSGDFTLYVYGE